MSEQFDVVIVGGGMVGATLAYALSKLPLRIALVDAIQPTLAKDERLIALNDGSSCLFKNLNLFEQLKPHAAAIEKVHVSHQGRFGITRISAEELNLAALGYVVPAKFINAVLAEALQSTSVALQWQSRLVAVDPHDNDTRLTFETPQGRQILSTRFVIAADGTHSTVRELLNIPITKKDYQQKALVTTTELTRPHENIAYERFLKEGVLAMLPLTGNRVATIWTGDSHRIESLNTLGPEEFVAELQREFGFRLGRFKTVTQRFMFPLQSVKAAERCRGNIFLIGNAFRTIHPLAAQGLNSALYEVAWLVEQFSVSEVTFESEALASWSQKTNTHLSHCLNSIFSEDFLPLNLVRQGGMLGLDMLTPIKKTFAASLAGRLGPLPPLFKENRGCKKP